MLCGEEIQGENRGVGRRKGVGSNILSSGELREGRKKEGRLKDGINDK